MTRYAANLNFMWTELEPHARFAAAARAGFTRVETLFVHALDPSRVEEELKAHGLALLLFDPAAGDWAKGDRGMLCVPGREAEFMGTLQAAVTSARRFGTKLLNALCGIAPAGVTQEQARETAIGNLRRAAPLVQQAGLTLLVENINTVDMPGYYASTPALAADLVTAVGHPAIRLQLDQYHCAMMGIDAAAAFREHAALVAHAQIADAPGRGQPGTGTQPIAEFLAALEQGGYAGSVGLEYKPRGTMDEALAWLPRPGRA